MHIHLNTRILKMEPQAVLWLLRMPDAATPRLQAEMSAAGVDPDRLIITHLFPRDVHLKVKSESFIHIHTYMCMCAYHIFIYIYIVYVHLNE